jgi:hypothetical protein
VTATDICGAQSSATAVVTVETDQDIQLSCPGDTTVFLCEPDTLRFPIDGIPAGAEITVGGTNVNWDPETNEAVRTQVRLGRSSVNTIEIVEGLNVGDRVILSDMSNWDAFDRVRLN